LKNANTLAHDGVHLVVLSHLQRRRRFGEEKIVRCAPNYMMDLGMVFCVDPLCFGSNMHVGCVALCISFLKYPRSSKLEFGAKSYRSFSAKSGAQTLALGLVECFYMYLMGQDPEMVRLLGPDRVRRKKNLSGTSVYIRTQR
jgi:hypothetical protein